MSNVDEDATSYLLYDHTVSIVSSSETSVLSFNAFPAFGTVYVREGGTTTPVTSSWYWSGTPSSPKTFEFLYRPPANFNGEAGSLSLSWSLYNNGSLTLTRTVEADDIYVVPAPDPVTNIDITAATAIPEGSLGGHYVSAINPDASPFFSRWSAEVVLTDADPIWQNNLTFQIDGTHGDDFEVLHTNASGEPTVGGEHLRLFLKEGAAVDFEAGADIFLTVTVSDGTGSATTSISIPVADFPETIQDASNTSDVFHFITTSTSSDYVVGNDENNTIKGNPGHDTIYGLAGDDILKGWTGNDLIFGGQGDDSIYGDADNDILFGEEGDDFLDGASGDDELYGGDGNDTIRGWVDNDLIFGGDGNDNLIGDSGNDTIHGGAGNDTLDGGWGDDALLSGSGADDLFGWNGDDLLDGGTGIDEISGGDGDDTIVFDASDTVVSGGSGTDTLVVSQASSTVDLSSNTLSSLEIFDATNGVSGDVFVFSALNIADLSGDEFSDGTDLLPLATFYGDAGDSLEIDGAEAILLGSQPDGNGTVFLVFKIDQTAYAAVDSDYFA